ncbi:MAG: hypothetical protein NZM12_02945 [Steroidobacteraceae bacterium]|nr:hypothetical protein [Steroidobacteraceae bacterium]MDW8258538.1 hypothetical protein [Gammaproteobacteria bacterium]
MFWHAPSRSWILLVAEPCGWDEPDSDARSRLRIYRSPDGLRWQHSSTLGPWDPPRVIWEMPQLFPLGSGKTSWCLLWSVADRRGQTTLCSVRYCFGNFDGYSFRPGVSAVPPTARTDTVRGPLLDHGPDFYAAIVARLPLPQRRGKHWVAIAWHSNWRDARALPWRGFAGGPMTVPRILGIGWDLRRTPCLAQRWLPRLTEGVGPTRARVLPRLTPKPTIIAKLPRMPALLQLRVA